MNKPGRREFFKIVGVAAIPTFLAEGMDIMQAQDIPNHTKNAKEFAPGEKVPTSGVYDVTHDKVDGDDHAQHHQITFIAGAVFPRCKGCGQWVRFRPYHAAENVEAAPHFAS